MDLRSPDLQLVRELGRGATSIVWLARARGSDDAPPDLALKRPRPELRDDPRARAALEREAEVLAAVRSPHVVALVDAGADDAGPWLVQRLLSGPTLRELLDAGGPLPEALWRSVARGLAEGLAAVHAAGWLHGDLKPDNARLDADGQGVWLDLGFARPFGRDPRDGAVARPGSLPWLSPEEARGGPATPAGEAFALGAVLYELATGEHPFASALRGGGAALLGAIEEARVPAASELAPRLSPFADRLLAELLARDTAQRPLPAEVARRLRAGEDGRWWRTVLEAPPPPEEPDPLALPLVGREAELEVLRAAWSDTCGRADGAIVWLTGEVGSGKTRLVREFVQRARLGPTPPMLLGASARGGERELAAEPFLALVARTIALSPGARPGPRHRAALDELVSPRDAQTLAEALEPGRERDESSDVPGALARWFAALARRARLVLFLDDLGQANDATVDVLTRLLDRLEGARLLLVLGVSHRLALRRPAALDELRERVARARNEHLLDLGPLDEAAVRELVARLFVSSAPRLEIARLLLERSQGNPALIAEIVRALVARGDAQRAPHGGGRLQLTVHPSRIPRPRTLREAILDSFRALPEADRAWLSRAALAGGHLRPELLARAFSEEHPGAVEAALARLVAGGWIRAVEGRYRFESPAARRYVDAELPAEERRAIHARLARALAPARGRPLAPAEAAQFVHHLRAARLDDELLRWILLLLPPLAQRGQTSRTRRLAEWGLEALARLPSTPARERTGIDLLEVAADATDRLGDREAQRGFLDRLAELELDAARDPRRAGRVYLLHARYALGVGQYGPARAMLRHAIRCFEEPGCEDLASDALRRSAALHAHTGELEAARRLARRALELAPDARHEAQAAVALGVIDVLEDRVESALREAELAVRRLHDEDGPQADGIRAQANLLRARAYRSVGRPRRALASAQRALRLARAAGERRIEAEASARLGGHLLDLDLAGEAEERLREGLRLAREIEDRRGEALASLFLGVLLAEEDRAEAGALLQAALDAAGALGLARVEAVARAIQARRLRSSGRLDAALAESEAAMELLAEAGAELMDRAVIVGTHAVLLHDRGRHPEAAELVRNLRRRLRRQNESLQSERVRRRQRVAATRWLAAVLSPEGPVYPRVRLDRGGGPAAPPPGDSAHESQ